MSDPVSESESAPDHSEAGELAESDESQDLLAAPGVAEPLLSRSPFRLGFFAAMGWLVAVGLIDQLVKLSGIIILVALSLFLALGLNPLVEFLIRHRVRRGFALLIVIVTMVGILTLGIWAVVPLIQDQITNLIRNAPTYLQQLRENPQIASLDQQFNIINKAIEFMTSGTWFNTIFGGIVGAGRIVASGVFSLIMTVVLTLYFLASLPTIQNTIYRLAPASRRVRVRYLANEMFDRIGGYLTGMFLVVTLWAIVSFILLNVVGLGRYSLALCVTTALFAFIPIVGSSVGMVICSIVAFSVSPFAGLITLLGFLFYQQMDAYVVQPRIFSRSLNVPGALVILGALSGGILLGVVGALLAIPTVASLLLLYREVLIPHLDKT